MSDNHEVVDGIKIIRNVLEHIRLRPGMYLGRANVHDLFMFLQGYMCAGGDISEYHNFGDFVRKKFKMSYTGPWSKIIEFHSCNEEQGWQLFMKLWSEYEQERDRKNKKHSRKQGIPGGGVKSSSGGGSQVQGGSE